jgi:hypothetical protein
MCVIVLLLVLGAALELSGIALVAWDVLGARREREQLSSRDVTVQVGAARAAAEGNPPKSDASSPRVTAPLEERVHSLERDVEKLSQRIDLNRRESKRDDRDMLDTVSDWVAEARQEVFELKQELRPTIGRVAAGNIRRRGSALSCSRSVRSCRRSRTSLLSQLERAPNALAQCVPACAPEPKT